MSNVKLSSAELALACNADLLLTKNLVIAKVYELFGQLSTNYQEDIKRHSLPQEVLKATPKISRGENYLGLPWVMLDYPRHFAANDIFSIRTMFWWGRHFSQFILLKGKFIVPNIIECIIQAPQKADWHICNGTDLWAHHFEPANMVEIKNLTAKQIFEIIDQAGFVKIGRKEPIEYWDDITQSMENGFNSGLQMLGY